MEYLVTEKHNSMRIGVYFTPAIHVEAPIDRWLCSETCGEPLTVSFHYMSVHWFPINVSLDKKAFSNAATQYRVNKMLSLSA